MTAHIFSFCLGMAMTSISMAASAQAVQELGAPASGSGSSAGSLAAVGQITWIDLDQDDDGQLSKLEVSPLPMLSELFEQVDVDGDGRVTPDEYKTFVGKQGVAGQG